MKQICIRRNTDLCSDKNLKFKFKHDQTTKEIGSIRIKKQTEIFVGNEKLLSEIIDIARVVYILYIIIVYNIFILYRLISIRLVSIDL